MQLVLGFFEVNQFRGDQGKKKARARRGRAALALVLRFQISDNFRSQISDFKYPKFEISSRSVGNCLQSSARIYGRQSDTEDCPLPGGTLNADVAGVLLNDAV
jgi:hypothetical protein